MYCMNEYGYYSRVLKKDFDTLEELEAAEKKYAAEQEEKKAKENKRGERAKEIEDALSSLKKMRVDHAEAERKLHTENMMLESATEADIKKLMSEFCHDYGTYRTSVNGDMVRDMFSIKFNWPFWLV